MSARRVLAGVLSSAVLCLSLSGCVSEGGDESMTADDAKLAALALEDRIAALVPSDLVAASEQRETGSLLNCDAERHQWSGRTTLALQGDVDFVGLLGSVAEDFSTGDGFTVVSDATGEGRPRITLIGEDGLGALVSQRGEDRLLITSFSPCFQLHEGVYPGGTF